jgi:YaiO family outer membrane protein
MRSTHTHTALALSLALACAAVAQGAWAQEAQPTATPNPNPNPTRSVELSTTSQQLSNGYGDWNDLTLRGVVDAGPHVLQAELSAKRQFGKDGVFVGVADTITLNPDWFTTLSLGAGDGAFYLPQLRGDAFLSRKWLEKRNFVTSIGLGYYHAPDGHTDRALSLGGAYYFEQPWIVELGVRMNRSDPGDISSTQKFVAVTYGKVGQSVLTARYGEGGEGYQAIALNTTIVNFQSYQGSLSWRHWFAKKTGFILGAEQYDNPSYQRRGVTLGLFHQF